MMAGKGFGLILAVCVAVMTAAFAPQASAQTAGGWRVVSEQTVGGFAWPESVGYDAKRKLLYAGAFGSKLDPGLKDGQGWISKLALDGKVLEEKFLPAPGGEALSKPKGIWIRDDRLWVTDIDVVWVFDLNTRKGRKLALPGVVFANDPAVAGNVLYVSDNRSDQIVRVEPADFLDEKVNPRISTAYKGAGIMPNGLFPARDGSLLIGGFIGPDKPSAIHALGADGQVKALSNPIGRLDGIYELTDGSVLGTDWDSGSLFHWSRSTGVQKLASGFKGPADFCVVPDAGGLTVVVPDLVQSQLRFIRLQK